MKVLVLGAHSDDSVLGCGGTMARLSQEKNIIWEVIFTNGAKYPPWKLNNIKLIKERKSEAKKASKILGVKKTIFFNINDTEIKKNIEESVPKLVKILKKFNPERVYVHHEKDMHTDHASVFKILSLALIKVETKPEIYGYEVNSWFNFIQKPDTLQVICDITSTYSTKLKALEVFKSQQTLIKPLKKILQIKGLYYGLTSGKNHTETFFKY